MKNAILSIGLLILIGADQRTFGQTTRFASDGPKPSNVRALIDISPIIVDAIVDSAYPVIDTASPLNRIQKFSPS